MREQRRRILELEEEQVRLTGEKQMQREIDIRQRLLDKSLSRSRSNDKTAASASKRVLFKPPQV